MDISTMGVIITVTVLVIVAIALNKLQKDLKQQRDNRDSKPKDKVDVKLFTQSGKLLYNWEGVTLSHWDKNIYNICDINAKKIARVDKGVNMLLISEYDSKKK